MSKVVSYAQRLGFFDVAKIGDQILYDDLGPALARDGPGAILPFITDAIKRLSPALIVIDSFKAVHDLATSTHEMRRIISSLAGVLSASDVTAFLIGEYTQSDSESHPEFAVADSIVQLERHSLGARDERFVRVLKLRGSGYREGQHAFQITGRGLKIFPRLVTPEFSDYDLNLRRIPTGVPGLDEIIGGGLWSGSTTVVVGSTGTGKTTIALQFALTGANSGDAALFVNFQENPAQVRRLISTLAGDEASDNADVHHLYFSPVELQIDSVIVTIFDLIRTRNIKRVVIDAVGDLATAASDAQRLHDYMYSLVQHFVVNDVTCLLNFESPIGTTGADEMQQRFSYMADNVLLLSPADESTRTIRVIKTRNSAPDRDAPKIRIDASGVKVH
jgi:circadian clock protein KaiC